MGMHEAGEEFHMKNESERRQQSVFDPEHAEPEVSNRDIARRAYAIYEQRGGKPGSELDDWLQAERELRDETKSEADQAA
jgi:hypothetical protein